MTGWRVLWDLRRRGVRLRVHDGRIQASGPLSPAERAAVVEHRDELLRLLDAEALADRFVDAIHAGADLPVLARAEREDSRRQLDEWEASRDETPSGCSRAVKSGGAPR